MEQPQAVRAADGCRGALRPGAQLSLALNAVTAALGETAGDDDQRAYLLLLTLLEQRRKLAPGDADHGEVDRPWDVQDGRIAGGLQDGRVARIDRRQATVIAGVQQVFEDARDEARVG